MKNFFWSIVIGVFLTGEANAQPFEKAIDNAALLPLGLSTFLVLALLLLSQWRRFYFITAVSAGVAAYFSFVGTLSNYIPNTWLFILSSLVALGTLVFWSQDLKAKLRGKTLDETDPNYNTGGQSAKLHLDPVTQIPNYSTAINVLRKH